MITAATAAVLFPPLLLAPVHLSVTDQRQPTFLWNGRFEAVSYQLELWQGDPDEAIVIGSGFAIDETDPQTSIAPLVRYTPNEPLPLGPWHWRVASVGEDGARSAWASGRRFRIAETDEDAIVLRPPPQRPYLHTNPGDMARLRAHTQTHPTFQRARQRLLAVADGLLPLEPPDENYARSAQGQHERYPLVAGITWNRVSVLGLAWQLTQDRRYAEKGREHLLVLAGYERWTGGPFLDPAVFDPPWGAALETAMTLYGMAIGYDWLHDYLSEADRSVIARAMLEKGLEPLMHAWVDPETAGRIPRHQMPGGNWAMVCAGAAGMGALALMDTHPEAAHWARQVRDRVRWWLHYEGGEYMVDEPWDRGRPKPVAGPDEPNFDDDGGYRESIGYMHYAMLFVNYFSDALRRVSDENLFEHYPPKLLDPIVATLYRANEQGREVERIADFGDTGATPNWHEFYACLMHNLQDGRAKALHDRIMGDTPTTARSLLWYDPDLPAASLRPPRAGHLFAGIGMAAFTTGSERRGAHAAMKTRFNRGHYDLGAMYFYSSGETWITDSGVYNYASPIYYEFLAHTQAQNLVMVDGERQVKADGEMESYIAGANYGYTRAQLAAAYPDRLVSWKREMVLIGPDTLLLIDRLHGQGPRQFEWLIHPAVPYRVLPKQGVELLGHTDRCMVHLLQPDTWEVEERDGYQRHHPRTYLAVAGPQPQEEASFVAVFAPDPGETGTSTLTRIDAPVGVDAFSLQRPDMNLKVWSSFAPRVLEGEGREAQARMLLVGEHDHASVLLAAHEAIWLRQETHEYFRSALPTDICLEWSDEGLRITVEARDAKGLALALPWEAEPPVATLNDAPLDMRHEAGVVHVMLPTGRHELQLAEPAKSGIAGVRQPAAMVAAHADAPIYHGAMVRVSSAAGDNLAHVVDGNDMTSWNTLPLSALPHWCEIDLPQPREISRVTLIPTFHQDMNVEVRANADAAWTPAGGIVGAPADTPVTFEFDKQSVASIRVSITRTGGQEDQGGLWEVRWR